MWVQALGRPAQEGGGWDVLALAGVVAPSWMVHRPLPLSRPSREPDWRHLPARRQHSMPADSGGAHMRRHP